MKSEPKYTGLGIVLGAALGAVFGVLAGNIGIWLGLGLMLGLALAVPFRRRQRETGCPQCEAMHRVHAARRQV